MTGSAEMLPYARSLVCDFDEGEKMSSLGFHAYNHSAAACVILEMVILQLTLNTLHSC
jgi:hypothetical protein